MTWITVTTTTIIIIWKNQKWWIKVFGREWLWRQGTSTLANFFFPPEFKCKHWQKMLHMRTLRTSRRTWKALQVSRVFRGFFLFSRQNINKGTYRDDFVMCNTTSLISYSCSCGFFHWVPQEPSPNAHLDFLLSVTPTQKHKPQRAPAQRSQRSLHSHSCTVATLYSPIAHQWKSWSILAKYSIIILYLYYKCMVLSFPDMEHRRKL